MKEGQVGYLSKSIDYYSCNVVISCFDKDEFCNMLICHVKSTCKKI